MRYLRSPVVERAMLAVDRDLFVPSRDPKITNWFDEPKEIGCGQFMSSPRWVSCVKRFFYLLRMQLHWSC